MFQSNSKNYFSFKHSNFFFVNNFESEFKLKAVLPSIFVEFAVFFVSQLLVIHFTRFPRISQLSYILDLFRQRQKCSLTSSLSLLTFKKRSWFSRRACAFQAAETENISRVSFEQDWKWISVVTNCGWASEASETTLYFGTNTPSPTIS